VRPWLRGSSTGWGAICAEDGGLPPARLFGRGEMAAGWGAGGADRGDHGGGVVIRWLAPGRPPRLALELVGSAAERGAMPANYLEATGLETSAGQVTGVRAVDRLSEAELLVRGRAVLVTAGAATVTLCGEPEPALALAHAYNPVLERKPPRRRLWPKQDDPTLARPLAAGVTELGCQVAFAARREMMAHTLADVVLRRTGLGQGGRPPADALAAAGEIMTRELGWDQARLGAGAGGGGSALHLVG